MGHLKTHEEVREQLRRVGMPIARWADIHKISRSAVYGVIYGRLSGEYGDAHKAAVLLGLKDGEVIQ